MSEANIINYCTLNIEEKQSYSLGSAHMFKSDVQVQHKQTQARTRRISWCGRTADNNELATSRPRDSVVVSPTPYHLATAHRDTEYVWCLHSSHSPHKAKLAKSYIHLFPMQEQVEPLKEPKRRRNSASRRFSIMKGLIQGHLLVLSHIVVRLILTWSMSNVLVVLKSCEYSLLLYVNINYDLDLGFLWKLLFMKPFFMC